MAESGKGVTLGEDLLYKLFLYEPANEGHKRKPSPKFSSDKSYCYPYLYHRHDHPLDVKCWTKSPPKKV